MANSFQDQFLKAGLVDKKKASKARKEKGKENRQKAKGAKITNEAKLQAERLLVEKKEHDRQLNLEKKEAADAKAIIAQIRQLIEVNRLSRKEGDIAFNFVDGTKVKKIYLPEKMHQQLSKGRLAIVKFDEGYEVVAIPIADKISLRSDDIVIHRDEAAPEDESDDPYADYQIPDDLMW
ncbi:MAG: DUF2058 domain-containing protein [Candidatus Polarisedimenticolaceae bacterium]|nr:DUF2058 domain-containing protein [Candidatus Polarisedimenticolaceae bacterium]